MLLLNFFAETLRKHPVAGNATRVANKPYRVPGTDFTIPEGMRVYIPIYAIHHHDRFYPNPEVFNPERFSEENGNDARTFLGFGDGKYSFSYFLISSFSHSPLDLHFICFVLFSLSFQGKRKCIGSEFAKVLVITGLVSLLRSFQFSTCERTQVPIQYSSTKNTLIPSDGVWLEVDRI